MPGLIVLWASGEAVLTSLMVHLGWLQARISFNAMSSPDTLLLGTKFKGCLGLATASVCTLQLKNIYECHSALSCNRLNVCNAQDFARRFNLNGQLPASVLLVGNPSLPLKGFDVAIKALTTVNKVVPISLTWICQTQPSAATVPELVGSGLAINLYINPSQVQQASWPLSKLSRGLSSTFTSCKNGTSKKRISIPQSFIFLLSGLIK